MHNQFKELLATECMDMRNFFALRLFAAAILLLQISCSSKSPLQGQWLLYVGKTTYAVDISHLNHNELMLSSDLAEISGRYEVHDKKMILVKANQPRISGVVFELNSSNQWTVTNSPPSVRLPIPIFGATLVKKL